MMQSGKERVGCSSEIPCSFPEVRGTARDLITMN